MEYAADTSRRIPRFDEERAEKEPSPAELSVAFIRFNIDGEPAADTDFLTPKEVHDLEIEVRISRWPDVAEALSLAPVAIEARSSHDFPTFRFLRPTGDLPYHLRDRGPLFFMSPKDSELSRSSSDMPPISNHAGSSNLSPWSVIATCA